MAEDSHMPSEILNRYNFDFIPQCDFKNLDSESANLSQDLPILLQPMSLEELQSFPVDESKLEEANPFLGFDEAKIGQWRWDTLLCTKRVRGNIRVGNQ